MKIDPNHLHLPDDPRFFVFGSNEAGINGGGAAWYAQSKLGAQPGLGEGLSGHTYALPTCSLPGKPLPLPKIKAAVDRFLGVARNFPAMRFFVSEVGCGLAGHVAADIAPMFAEAPANCDLPPTFKAIIAGLPK